MAGRAWSGIPWAWWLSRRRSVSFSSTVVADARLQDSISGPARATVTSLAGMSTDVATVAVYGSYAALVVILAATAAPLRC